MSSTQWFTTSMPTVSCLSIAKAIFSFVPTPSTLATKTGSRIPGKLPRNNPPNPPIFPSTCGPCVCLTSDWIPQADLGYCEHDQYVLEWAADRQRILLDGRAIETRQVRYSADAGSLKVENLRDGIELVGYWRLVPIDDDHVKWTENAELRRDRAGLEVVAKPD